MSATGGGHKASAEAIKSAFEQQYPNQFEISMVDLLIDCLPSPLNQLPKTYAFLANDAQWAWKLLWDSTNHPTTVHRLMEYVARISQRNVRTVLQSHQPDLIISVHPLVHEMTFRALDRLRWQRPFVTVVTDLADTHPLWFHRRVDACYVASEKAWQHGLQVGMRASQLYQFGLPVRPAFAASNRSQRELRQQLGIDPNLPAVLVMGGGDGIGPVAEITRQLAWRLQTTSKALGQVVVICGRNRSLYEELLAQDWPIPVKINGFVSNMAEWMSACDCLVSKAGPGTIAEALICGLPIVLSGFIPGQEAGNVSFVVESGAGAFSPHPAEIAEIVAKWLQSPKQLEQLHKVAKQLARPQATFQIVESIMGLLQHAQSRIIVQPMPAVSLLARQAEQTLESLSDQELLWLIERASQVLRMRMDV